MRLTYTADRELCDKIGQLGKTKLKHTVSSERRAAAKAQRALMNQRRNLWAQASQRDVLDYVSDYQQFRRLGEARITKQAVMDFWKRCCQK